MLETLLGWLAAVGAVTFGYLVARVLWSLGTFLDHKSAEVRRETGRRRDL